MNDRLFLLSQIMILLGLVLQLLNVVRSLRFVSSQRDAVSAKQSRDRTLGYVVAGLIVFFAPVYAYILFAGIRNVWVGALLFTSAIFVTVVLEWIINLVGSVRAGMLELSQTLVGVMEASDPNLNGHSMHVQNLSLLLYDNLPAKRRRSISRADLGYAALLHDIGKMGISERILQKPGRLTGDEMDLVHDHPRIGAEILSTVDAFDNVARWVLYHHERVDGKGYYDVPGDEIPLASRLISVADTYSAVTMRRSYKDPRSYNDGVRVLREVAGTQLDPELVEAFCAIDRLDVLACAPDTIEIEDALGGADSEQAAAKANAGSDAQAANKSDEE